MTDSRNISTLERAWTTERRHLRDKIEIQAETIYQLRAKQAATPTLPPMNFPPDLPIPFRNMKLWYHLYERRGTVVPHEELCALFCRANTAFPINSLQVMVAKIHRHLRNNHLLVRYGITNVPKVGYILILKKSLNIKISSPQR